MNMADEPDDGATGTISKYFLKVEHAIYIALGGLLSVLALVALTHAALDVFRSLQSWNEAHRVFRVMAQLLFALMLAEILHTVRVSMRSGVLQAEPFLIVGLIASIRRVLVITLQSSEQDQGSPTAGTASFQAAMIELGVLGMLILVMVVSIYLIRLSVGSTQKKPGATSAPGG